MSISSKHILFDLDGTLVNSSEGIINAFTYSFSKMNTEIPDKHLLASFIGPPLETSLKTFFPMKKNSTKPFITSGLFTRPLVLDKHIYILI
ncbi:HAD hydrolase-like protein [Streptococcus iniae]